MGDEVFKELHDSRHWMKDLRQDSKSWQGWLKSQWQFYWAAVPIGKEGEAFKNASILESEKDKFEPWLNAQNAAFNSKLFQTEELNFLRQACQNNKDFSVNVGSWWSSIFDQTRYALSAVKNARSWQIPTAFAPRSTVSGIGPVVHPGNDWVTEGETKKYWERHAGLFDGREQLNATETVKRGLEKVLPKLLGLDESDIAASYPDLTTGVAGYLKVSDRLHLAIALENLWSAEAKAKEHSSPDGNKKKDAVQVRVLYGNGNILKVTAKFSVFHQWQQLLNVNPDIESSIFEQAANSWNQYPAPILAAIQPWTQAFCDRLTAITKMKLSCNCCKWLQKRRITQLV